MDSKFAVDLRDYIVVKVGCPDCHVKYGLRLRLDHLALCQKENSNIFVRCPNCCKFHVQKH